MAQNITGHYIDRCEVWRFGSGVAEDSRRPGYDAMSIDKVPDVSEDISAFAFRGKNYCDRDG